MHRQPRPSKRLPLTSASRAYWGEQMSLDERAASSEDSTNVNAVLAGSIGSVVATGMLYFVGGAYYAGYSRALGLNFLAGLQPAGYIFYGAQFLIALSIPQVSLMLVAVLATLRVARKGIWGIPKGRFSLKPECRFVVGLVTVTVVASTLLELHLLHSIRATKTLIASSPCSWPINPSATGGTSFWFVVSAVLGGISFQYLRQNFLRWTSLVLCSAISLLALYGLGHELAAARLYGDRFQIAEISMSSPQSFPALQVLILGSDDKNMVVLFPPKDRGEKPQPTYLQRADLKSVRIVSSPGIREFFCKQKSTANQ